MAEQAPIGARRWIKTGWAALIIGWLSYFALMAFATRSPWMHSYAAYMAVAFGMAVLVSAFLAWRNGEGGHWRLLIVFLLTPVIWYFFAVLAMTIIAYRA